jgi:hypothetical protein
MISDSDQAKVRGTMEAMMTMKKLEIAPLKRAFEGG